MATIPDGQADSPVSMPPESPRRHECERGWAPVVDPSAYWMRVELQLGVHRGLGAVVKNTLRPCEHCRPDLAERWAHGAFMPSNARRSVAA